MLSIFVVGLCATLQLYTPVPCKALAGALTPFPCEFYGVPIVGCLLLHCSLGRCSSLLCPPEFCQELARYHIYLFWLLSKYPLTYHIYWQNAHFKRHLLAKTRVSSPPTRLWLRLLTSSFSSRNRNRRTNVVVKGVYVTSPFFKKVENHSTRNLT